MPFIIAVLVFFSTISLVAAIWVLLYIQEEKRKAFPPDSRTTFSYMLKEMKNISDSLESIRRSLE